MGLTAQSDSDTRTINIYRAYTAVRRNRLAGPTPEGDHQRIVDDPVTSRQFSAQGELRLIGRFCFHIAQPVGYSVDMCIHANAGFAVSERNNQICCFAPHALDTEQIIQIIRHFGVKAFN